MRFTLLLNLVLCLTVSLRNLQRLMFVFSVSLKTFFFLKSVFFSGRGVFRFFFVSFIVSPFWRRREKRESTFVSGTGFRRTARLGASSSQMCKDTPRSTS